MIATIVGAILRGLFQNMCIPMASRNRDMNFLLKKPEKEYPLTEVARHNANPTIADHGICINGESSALRTITPSMDTMLLLSTCLST